MPKVQPLDHDAGGRGRRGRRTSTSLAEINVVPLVDVMLVLLIIFMVTAPMMQRGMEVKLPTSRRAAPIASERLFVTVPLSYRKDRKVFLGEDRTEPVSVDLLAERIRQAMLTRAEKSVFLKGDGDISLRELMVIFDSLNAAGVANIGIVAAPPEK